MSSQTFDAETVDAIFSERDQLKAENAKLVDVLHEVETEAVYAYHCLQSDIELVMKSETEFFEKWWHSECRNSNKLRRIEVLEAENAKLRAAREMAVEDAKSILVNLSNARAENAKLRELAADMLHDAMENVCSRAYWCDEKNWQTCNDKSCGNHLYVDMARELGIEVDE